MSIFVYFKRDATDADRSIDQGKFGKSRFWTVDAEEAMADQFATTKIIVVEDKDDKSKDLSHPTHKGTIMAQLADLLQGIGVTDEFMSRIGKGVSGHYQKREFKDGKVVQEYPGTILWFATDDSGIARKRGLRLEDGAIESNANGLQLTAKADAA